MRLSGGILKKKKKKPYTATKIPQTLKSCSTHSVNQLSIYGAVANWCEQFSLTEQKKGRINLSMDNNDIDKCTTRRSTTFCISSDKDIWKQFARKHFELRGTVQDDGWRSIVLLPGTDIFSSSSGITSLWNNSWGNNHWTSCWSSKSWEFLKNTGQRFQFHQFSIP